MTACVFMIPGELSAPTGGYVYARKILPLLGEKMETDVCALPAGFPFPTDAELQETARAIAEWDRQGRVFLIDGLAYGAMPKAIISAVQSPIAALVHHPLGLEEGLQPEQRQRLLRLEGEALALARSVVVPSAAIAGELTRLFGVAPDKITIAEPGVLRGKRAAGTPAGEPLHIVSVGTLTPRKGVGVLIGALNDLRDLPWRASIAGSLSRSPETVAEVRRRITSYGLGGRVELLGQLEEQALSALYSSGDVFALASYYEGYGMVLAEAMAHGLPAVASGGGAVAGTVPPGAGFVCAPGAVSAIADALRALLTSPALRRSKAEAAWQAAQALPEWPATAAIIVQVIERTARSAGENG